MSKFFTLCRTNKKCHSFEEVRKAKRLLKKPKVRATFNGYFSLIFLGLILMISSFYIFQITGNATDGFKISVQEKKVSELKLAQEALREKVNILENMNSLKSKAEELGLAPVEKVEHLEGEDRGVAMKK